ncbi:hypothetical protein CsSME_00038259 [Camellia sinensis var. sinensis]
MYIPPSVDDYGIDKSTMCGLIMQLLASHYHYDIENKGSNPILSGCSDLGKKSVDCCRYNLVLSARKLVLTVASHQHPGANGISRIYDMRDI